MADEEYVPGPLDTGVALKVVVPPYTHYKVQRYTPSLTNNFRTLETIDVFAHDIGPLADGDSASIAFTEYFIIPTPAGDAMGVRFVRFVREWYDVQIVVTPVTVN